MKVVCLLKHIFPFLIIVCNELKMLHYHSNFAILNYSYKQSGYCIHFVNLAFEIKVHKNNEGISFCKLFFVHIWWLIIFYCTLDVCITMCFWASIAILVFRVTLRTSRERASPNTWMIRPDRLTFGKKRKKSNSFGSAMDHNNYMIPSQLWSKQVDLLEHEPRRWRSIQILDLPQVSIAGHSECAWMHSWLPVLDAAPVFPEPCSVSLIKVNSLASWKKAYSASVCLGPEQSFFWVQIFAQ
jgi:hypothetical protein